MEIYFPNSVYKPIAFGKTNINSTAKFISNCYKWGFDTNSIRGKKKLFNFIDIHPIENLIGISKYGESF